MTLARKHQTYPFFSYPEVRDVRDGNTVFSAVAADRDPEFWPGSERRHPACRGAEVSGQYFEVVGIKPFLGRVAR